MRKALIVGAGIVLLASCSKSPAIKDLPVTNQKVDVSDRKVYANPDRFPNVVVWCDGSSRVYVTSREMQNFVVVPNSPECPVAGQPQDATGNG